MHDVSTTAAAFGQAVAAIQVLAGLPLQSMLLYVVLGFLGLLGTATLSQHFLEYVIAKVKPPIFIKLLLPTAWSHLLAYATMALGAKFSPGAAEAAAISFAGWIHVINQTGLAAELESKFSGLGKVVNALDEAGQQLGAKVAMVLVGFLLLGAAAHADVTPTAVAGWCAGPAAWGGSAIYHTEQSGLVLDQSDLLGFSFSGYLGSWTGETFRPSYTLGAIVAVAQSGQSANPAVGIQGGFYLLDVPVTAFFARRLDKDAQGLMVGVGTSIQFSGWVPFLYLGHPGN